MARTSRISLFDVAEPDVLRFALQRAARGARHSLAYQRFQASAEYELSQLRREILTDTVEVGRVTRFEIRDPKPRLIQAPVFRERVLQHAVMCLVGPVLERTLVSDTFACRVGRGTIAAVRRAQHHARRWPWYGQIDIRHYFASVTHEILLARLDRLFGDRGVRNLLRRIVTAQGTARGLPIGAHCSQHFANFYLSSIDRLVLEQTDACGYVRYMDDLVCWGSSRDAVASALAAAERSLIDNLRLQLRDRPIINRVRHGLSFCGFRIFPGILRALPRRRQRYIRARRRWESRYCEGGVDSLGLQRGYDSAAGILAQVDSLAWRRRQLEMSPPPVGCDDA